MCPAFFLVLLMLSSLSVDIALPYVKYNDNFYFAVLANHGDYIVKLCTMNSMDLHSSVLAGSSWNIIICLYIYICKQACGSTDRVSWLVNPRHCQVAIWLYPAARHAAQRGVLDGNRLELFVLKALLLAKRPSLRNHIVVVGRAQIDFQAQADPAKPLQTFKARSAVPSVTNVWVSGSSVADTASNARSSFAGGKNHTGKFSWPERA